MADSVGATLCVSNLHSKSYITTLKCEKRNERDGMVRNTPYI